MKKGFVIGLVALLCTGCIPFQIVTQYYPTTSSQSTQVVASRPTYTTQTTVVTKVPSQPKTTTTTIVTVNQYSNDLSFYLDLQAVAAAFAQSNSIEEFEMILNSSSYLISNLDLNSDGMVDYLRVVETMQGYNHVFVIQAVLAQNIYQDVASLVVEMDYTTPYVQIIGAPYIYGANYYLKPVFVQTPPMFNRFRAYGYTPWTSPYHWGYFPKHYGHPAPVVLSHYQACIHNFLSQHHYCHEANYESQCHYNGYEQMHQQVARNDYQQQHPQQSFANRNSGAKNGSSSSSSSNGTVRNTRDLQYYVTANNKNISGTRVSAAPTVRATETNATQLRTSGTSTTRTTTTNQNGTTTTSIRRSTGVTTTTSTPSRTSTTSGGGRR